VKITVCQLVFFVLGALTVIACTDPGTGTGTTFPVTNDFHPVGPAWHRTRGLDFCRFGCPTDMYGYEEVQKLRASKKQPGPSWLHKNYFQ
jgi:hypothetical protein